MSNLDRISAPDYIPTEQDVLRVRFPTTGIHDYSFTIKTITLRWAVFSGTTLYLDYSLHCANSIIDRSFVYSRLCGSSFPTVCQKAPDTALLSQYFLSLRFPPPTTTTTKTHTLATIRKRQPRLVSICVWATYCTLVWNHSELLGQLQSFSYVRSATYRAVDLTTYWKNFVFNIRSCMQRAVCSGF